MSTNGTRPHPVYLAGQHLTRTQLCGRIRALGDALDLVQSQADRDWGGDFDCEQRMRIELLALGRELFDRDQREARGERVRLAAYRPTRPRDEIPF